MTRPLNNGYSNIDPTITMLPFINAIGSQPTLSYHKVHAPSFLTLLPVANENKNKNENKNVAAGTCMCKGAKVPFGQGHVHIHCECIPTYGCWTWNSQFC